MLELTHKQIENCILIFFLKKLMLGLFRIFKNFLYDKVAYIHKWYRKTRNPFLLILLDQKHDKQEWRWGWPKKKRGADYSFFGSQSQKPAKKTWQKYVASSENDCAWTYLREICKENTKIIFLLS